MFVYYTKYIGAQIMTYKMQRLTGGKLEKVDGWRSPPCEENCLPCEEKSLPCEENCLPFEENCGPAVNPLVIVVDVINLCDVEFMP